MRWTLGAVLAVALVLTAPDAAALPTRTFHVKVTGLKVKRPYFFAMQTVDDAPARLDGAVGARRRGVRSGGNHHWPYLASLTMLGLVWAVRRRWRF